MINIIYNTIQNKILPEYQHVYNLHISFDLLYCKGGLQSDNYVIRQKKNNKCYKLTNEFGYSYVGHYKNCLSKICDEIKNVKPKRYTYSKEINVEEYFLNLFNMKFEDVYSQQSTNEFIQDLIDTEKKINSNRRKRKAPNENTTINNKILKSDLIEVFNIIQKLKKEHFSQSGSGKKKKKVINEKKKVINEKKKVINEKKTVITKKKKVINEKKKVINQKKKVITKKKN
jgi:hypothetical protein